MAHDKDDQISMWLGQLKAGDQEAVQKLWERYFVRLTMLARRALANAPQAAGDEEDVAQSAFKSFYVRAQAGKFPKLVDRDDLWKLLMTIALRKSSRKRRKEQRHVTSDPEVLAAELAADAPQPETTALITDELRRLFGKLDDPVLAGIALMKLEGLTNRQIARAMDLSVATIERKLQVIRHLWGDEVRP